MTQYDQTFPLPQAFPPFSLARILAEVLADHGRTQFRTAETEKYPHVTYFFNGGYEPPYPGEERCLIPSQRVATYDLAPEMSAYGITEALCRTIEGGAYDFILCNYANADMGTLDLCEHCDAIDLWFDPSPNAQLMALANALLVIPEGQYETPVGAQVQAILLEDPVHQTEPGF